MSFLFRIAAALLTTNRSRLLSCSDSGEAYMLLSHLGGEITDQQKIDELLHTAGSLRRMALLEPHTLAEMRRTRAALLKEERGSDASDVAAAAVAVATQTAMQLLSERREASQQLPCLEPPAAVPIEWDLVATPSDDEASDGWSLVEPSHECQPAPGGAPRPGCSLSYVIMQLEAPTVLEGHFDVNGMDHDDQTVASRLTSLQVIGKLSADLDALI